LCDKKEIDTVLRLYQKGKTAAEIADLLDLSVAKVTTIINHKY